jgi:chaperonin GroES
MVDGNDETLDGADGGEGGDQKQPVRMTADRILVSQRSGPGERRSRAGIVIPATAALTRRLVWGEVRAIGPTVRHIEPGDRVLFSPDDSFEVDLRGDGFLIVRERDIHAVASERGEGQTGLYL